jgi:hypothetical protein
MKITLPALPSGEWQDEEGTVYAGDRGILAVVRKGQSSPIQFRGPEIEAVATAISALPDLIQALADIATDLRHGAGNPQTMANLACEALQKAGAVIAE